MATGVVTYEAYEELALREVEQFCDSTGGYDVNPKSAEYRRFVDGEVDLHERCGAATFADLLISR